MPDARIGFAFSPDFSQATRLRFTPPAITTTAGSMDEKGVTTVPVSSSLTGCLTQKQPTAEYLIPVVKGQPLVISAEARSLDLLLDPVMKLVDPVGAVIAEIDDTGATRDAAIVHTAAQDGLYRLTITDRFRKGGERCWYLLTVRLDQPDYDLAVISDAVVVAVQQRFEISPKPDALCKFGFLARGFILLCLLFGRSIGKEHGGLLRQRLGRCEPLLHIGAFGCVKLLR